ncbi:MAG: CapA family protein [Clostridia bacterium]|nr:CapA family protein [Clostridia bacterium]
MTNRDKRRGISAGTIAALSGCGLLLVLFLVLTVRFGGSCGQPAADISASPTRAAAEPGAQGIVSSDPAASRGQAGRAASAPTAAPSAAPRSFTLTAGGTIAMEPDVISSGYYRDVKAYDYDDVLALLTDDLRADINLVSLENLIVPGAKVSGVIAPAEVMRMLRRGGFDTVALGFPKCGEKGADAIRSTLSAAISAGLRPIGICSSLAEAAPAAMIREVNGIRVALLHYTMTPTAASKKQLKKESAMDLLPLTAQAAADVTAARSAGAEVVIVSLNWGKVNATSPAKDQKQLAQSLADAGADVLIGAGSRCVQSAEWLTGNRADGSAGRTLCLWSLGCLLSASRSNNAVAGMLAHLTVTVGTDGRVTTEAAYTPTFAWRYNVASTERYQVVSALRDAPDAMNSDQRSALTKARTRIEKAMNGAPLFERTPR